MNNFPITDLNLLITGGLIGLMSIFAVSKRLRSFSVITINLLRYIFLPFFIYLLIVFLFWNAIQNFYEEAIQRNINISNVILSISDLPFEIQKAEENRVNAIKELLDLIKILKEKGYNETLRAGQSMMIMLLSA